MHARTGDLGLRTRDVVVAAVGLIIAAPVLGATALAVGCTLGRPVLFRQERAGRGGRPFVLLKFRTMRAGPGDDAARLTRFGRWLRATSLDELPQLWNVLRGDMSLVGPRPLPTAYTARYRSDQARRLDVLPGLTGWAQVHGRNAVDWSERFALDTWYVEHRCARVELLILLRTVGVVLRARGIRHESAATMPEFLGCEQST